MPDAPDTLGDEGEMGEVKWTLTDKGANTYPGESRDAALRFVLDDVRHDLEALVLPDGTTAAGALDLITRVLLTEYDELFLPGEVELTARALRSLLGEARDA